MSTWKLTSCALIAASGVFVFACASVLGIEQATLDPALDKATTTDAGRKSLCDTYCDILSANCTGNVEQFVSKDVCKPFCQKLDPGTPGDTTGNSVNCRLTYAKLAKSAGETSDNCSIAGPGGNGQCGTNCDALCTVALKTCATEVSAFVDVNQCDAECTRLPDVGHFDDSIQDNFNVQCRLYHVSAAQLDPQLHCPHVRGIGKCNAQSPP
jgi:hypothetical protein